MVQAAQIASGMIPYHRDNINAFSRYCAFDMFNTFMFGELTKTVVVDGKENDETTVVSSENQDFCNYGVVALTTGINLTRKPYDLLFGKYLGFSTANYRIFKESAIIVRSIGFGKMHRFMERKKKYGTLTKLEEA